MIQLQITTPTRLDEQRIRSLEKICGRRYKSKLPYLLTFEFDSKLSDIVNIVMKRLQPYGIVKRIDNDSQGQQHQQDKKGATLL